jgi:hypothetical protein
MPWYFYLLEFLGGAFLANGVPHFVHGVSGAPFQSPFAKPPGVGESSALSNVRGGVCAAALFLAGGCGGVGGVWCGSAGDFHSAVAAFRESAGGAGVDDLFLLVVIGLDCDGIACVGVWLR